MSWMAHLRNPSGSLKVMLMLAASSERHLTSSLHQCEAPWHHSGRYLKCREYQIFPFKGPYVGGLT